MSSSSLASTAVLNASSNPNDFSEGDTHRMNLQACIQLLIELNNSLDQPDAARGVLAHAQKAAFISPSGVPAKWHELLRNWEDALKVQTVILHFMHIYIYVSLAFPILA